MEDPYARFGAVDNFELTSHAIADGVPLPAAQRSAGQGGSDTSPDLDWSGFPSATKSFAVTCFDPDAPTGSGFWHWAVYNIPASTTSLAAGSGEHGSGLLPTGAATVSNDLRLAQYTGAEPPEGTGTHHYYFVVHALDVESLDIPDGATPAVLGFNIHFHTLARAMIVPSASFGETS